MTCPGSSTAIISSASRTKRALAVVAKAHQTMASDDPEAIEDVLPKAYATVPNATPEFEDRMPVIFAFVRSHSELFHSNRAMP